jgi:hypothetical protein
MSGWEDPVPNDDPMTNPLDLDPWDKEIEVEEDEKEMCDHDEHKEVVPQSEMRGASAMGVSGQVGTSEALIVCKKCGKARPAERVDSGNQDPLGW